MATFQAVLASESLLSCVIAFQRGLDGRIADIHRQMTSHEPLTEKPPNVEVLGSIVLPWLLRHGKLHLPRLLRLLPYMKSVVSAHAAFTGSLELFQSMPNLATSFRRLNLIDIAAERVIILLHSKGLKPSCGKSPVTAAVRNHVDVVGYLTTRCARDCKWFTQDEALLNDCPLEIVQVLVENRAKLPLAKTMDLAAKRGRLDVVTFLHVHGLEGCTTKAVDGAAARGFTDVVDFLL
ncbi:hypothetical protein DYB25_010437 [Aphanomyces astaci]|uniref:Uncharacterized protein n=1 Tax=Aphanomyces astaci TaxID=112090 RepID=A0A397APY6_APHAT|nr:hypothetical protein DYB25_010437 [Aphanomyces astaci]RHY38577.1 hypothetical protein DYB38_014311 [Aphanomyces astaci]RHZ29299.1 hypothetical protein DYB26_005401 [Aphanomyces astaci]RHZ38613.1 hypothetical protein DYB31_016768 [Aphanomyces astaci]